MNASNETNANTCRCDNCAGAACQCGCQDAKPAKSCRCGAECRSDAACQCEKA